MLPERIDRARDLCAEWVKSGHTPAIVALVARRGVICLHEAFGKLRPETDSPPVQLDTIWPIMSITKPMVSTLVLQLVEDGLLGLNRPVRDYLPEVKGKGTEEMLVHHLLTFTAGYDEFDFIVSLVTLGPDLGMGLSGEAVWDEVMRRLYEAPLARPPGQEMEYLFLSYEILKKILERVSGRSFPDLIQERLFTPLGMNDSYAVVPESVSPRVVKRPAEAPWNSQMGPLLPIDSRENEERPDLVFSTARDVATFGQMVLNGGTYGGARILSRPTVTEMTRNQTPGIPVKMGPSIRREASYGYGWFVRTNEK